MGQRAKLRSLKGFAPKSGAGTNNVKKLGLCQAEALMGLKLQGQTPTESEHALLKTSVHG